MRLPTHRIGPTNRDKLVIMTAKEITSLFVAAGLTALFAPSSVLAQDAQGDVFAEEAPPANSDDPFVEEAADGTDSATSPSGSSPSATTDGAAPPPAGQATVPEGYNTAEPLPQPGYGEQPQQAYGTQPGYSPYQPRPRLRRMPYREGVAPPPGATLVERRRIGMIIAGAAMFAVPVAIMAVFASDGIYSGKAAIPLVGPFIEMGEDFLFAIDRFFLATMGLVQAAGLTLFIIGLTTKKRYYEVYAGNQEGWIVNPRATRSGGSLELIGRF